MENAKVYAVQYLDSCNDACRIWENGRTKKFTLEDARVQALEMVKRTGKTSKICKGWTVIEVYNP